MMAKRGSLLMPAISASLSVYDAITRDRPYRAARSKQEAIEELRLNAGTQFDPAAVEPVIAHVAAG